MIRIDNGTVSAEIALRGAELRSLKTADGAEWLWQGDPAWWAGRSPLLFPVIGKSPGGQVTLAGRRHEMPAHGIARTSDFDLVDSGEEHAAFQLTRMPATDPIYPYDFLLRIDYRLSGAQLSVEAKVENLGSVPMHFQFGYHPAFNWPLPGGAERRHLLTLADGREPALARLNSDFLLAEHRDPSPFSRGKLEPLPELFDDDAMIFPDGAGDRFDFAAENGPCLTMQTRNLPQFALWQKPGAPFLCLEPWQGTAPQPRDGNALETRNGALSLAPGETRSFGMDIGLYPAGKPV